MLVVRLRQVHAMFCTTRLRAERGEAIACLSRRIVNRCRRVLAFATMRASVAYQRMLETLEREVLVCHFGSGIDAAACPHLPRCDHAQRTCASSRLWIIFWTFTAEHRLSILNNQTFV